MKLLFHRSFAYLPNRFSHRYALVHLSYYFQSGSHRNFVRSRHKKSPNPIYLSLPSLASHMNRIISGETYEEKIESERKETERVTEEARKRRLTDHHWFLQRAMELSNLKEPYSDLINLIRG